jgi:hypothetical protein
MNIPIVDWILYLAIHNYCFTIEVLERDVNVDIINIHDGNWGCGVFNHNINTIYTLLHISINIAIQIMKPKKKVIYWYHSFNKQTDKFLQPAKTLLHNNRNKDVLTIINQVKEYHKCKHPYWFSKF